MLFKHDHQKIICTFFYLNGHHGEVNHLVIAVCLYRDTLNGYSVFFLGSLKDRGAQFGLQPLPCHGKDIHCGLSL